MPRNPNSPHNHGCEPIHTHTSASENIKLQMMMAKLEDSLKNEFVLKEQLKTINLESLLGNGNIDIKSIDKIEKASEGLVDTYTIYFINNAEPYSFTVTNGTKGEKGDKGDKGEAFKYEDFTKEQLEALRGDKGAAFTYEDFTEEQLLALKGEKGNTGEKGADGKNGLTTAIQIGETVYEHVDGTISLPEFLTEHQSLEGYATESWVENQGYLKEHQDLSAYALKSEIPVVSDFITEGQLTETLNDYYDKQETTAALSAKADNIPFTEDLYVTKAVGSFKVGDPVKGLSIKEILAKLLELSPEEPTGIIGTILYNQLPIYEIDENDVMQEVPFKIINYTVDEYATVRDNQTGFYVVKNAAGKIIEAGYQHYSTAKDPYYIVALPDMLDVSESGNTEMHSWNTMVQPNAWTEVGKYTLTGNQDEIVATYNADGYTPPVAADGYRLWADLSQSDPGTLTRFVIKE